MATGKPVHECQCDRPGVVLGHGTYGEVRRALWAGALVAAKRCFADGATTASSSSADSARTGEHTSSSSRGSHDPLLALSAPGRGGARAQQQWTPRRKPAPLAAGMSPSPDTSTDPPTSSTPSATSADHLIRSDPDDVAAEEVVVSVVSSGKGSAADAADAPPPAAAAAADPGAADASAAADAAGEEVPLAVGPPPRQAAPPRDYTDEVEAVARLRHPHIILFLGVAGPMAEPTLVTELAERGSLFTLLRTHRTVGRAWGPVP